MIRFLPPIKSVKCPIRTFNANPTIPVADNKKKTFSAEIPASSTIQTGKTGTIMEIRMEFNKLMK